MKSKIFTVICLLCFSFSSFSQLDKIYKNRKWDVFVSATSFSYKQGDEKESFSFIKPFYVRIGTDRSEVGKKHFSWHMPLGSELIWGSIMKLKEDSEINDLDKFNRRGISSGILGLLNLKWNIIGSDEMVVAAGAEFGDFAFGDGWNAVIGPSVLVEKAISESMAVGINISYSKVVASTDKNVGSLWLMSIYPRLLFESGWYLEAGIMTVSGDTPADYSRLDINIGKSFSW